VTPEEFADTVRESLPVLPAPPVNEIVVGRVTDAHHGDAVYPFGLRKVTLGDVTIPDCIPVQSVTVEHRIQEFPIITIVITGCPVREEDVQ
jgi:hypothetical protein